jgi:hypothetical protein
MGFTNTQDFFNTISETGDELRDSKLKARTQQDIILDFFKDRRGQMLTPWFVHTYCRDLEGALLTSIRRAITNLTDDGYLIKTKIQEPGGYGKKNYCWYMPRSGGSQLELF